MPENHTWSVRIAGTEDNQARVFTRSNRLEIGAPLSFDPEYGELTAIDCVLGAVGADIVNGFRLLAEHRGIAIDHIEAVVSGELENALAFLGVVGEEGSPRISVVSVRVFVSSPASNSEIDDVWQLALARSPLACTFASLTSFDAQIATSI